MVTRWEVYLPGLLMQGQRLYSDSAAEREISGLIKISGDLTTGFIVKLEQNSSHVSYPATFGVIK